MYVQRESIKIAKLLEGALVFHCVNMWNEVLVKNTKISCPWVFVQEFLGILLTKNGTEKPRSIPTKVTSPPVAKKFKTGSSKDDGLVANYVYLSVLWN